jgi:hypothetical protein
MMDCKGFERKRWYILTRHLFGGTEETKENRVRLTDVLTEIRAKHLPERITGFYHHANLTGKSISVLQTCANFSLKEGEGVLVSRSSHSQF